MRHHLYGGCDMGVAQMTHPRNGLIAKIHIARTQLALDEECYRALLRRVTGKDSSAAMSISQLEAVLGEFRRLGFSGKPPRAGKRKMATEPQAKKIRALWLVLYRMGALRDPSEEALAGFAARTCGVDDLHWITPGDADRIIRALRGWIDRLETQGGDHEKSA